MLERLLAVTQEILQAQELYPALDAISEAIAQDKEMTRELLRAVAMMSAVADAVGPQAAVIAVAYADAGALDPPALAPGWGPAVRQSGCGW